MTITIKLSRVATCTLFSLSLAIGLTVMPKPSKAAVKSASETNLATESSSSKTNLDTFKPTADRANNSNSHLLAANEDKEGDDDEGNQRLLYVANDATGKIDIFDINNKHKLIRSIDVPGNSFRGITAHAGTKRLYFTNAEDDKSKHLIAAIDLTTEKIVWQFNPNDRGCKKPDRLNVTFDGMALYVPCKNRDIELILNASDGSTIKTIPIPDDPHNTFTGEQGKYMYMSARSSTVFHVADPKTHTIVRSIDGFSSPVRPFSINPSETFVFANLANVMGFAVVDMRDPNPNNWKKLMEVQHQRPAKLPPYIDSPHGDNPQSHGIAVRPGGKEVWFIDDHYGFLYVYDITTLPNAPKHVATVPLFSDYSKPWTDLEQRWMTFDIKGKYAYAPNGWVINASARKDTGMRISPSEKMVEVDYKDGVPVRTSGQNGGVYPQMGSSKED
jgi:hypothetical protein